MARLKAEHSETPEEATQRKGRLESKISKWREALLDLSKRNKLLYFSGARTSTVQIISPGSRTLFQLLVEEEASLSFPRPAKKAPAKQPAAPSGNGTEESHPEVIEGDVAVAGSVEELQSKLIRLRRDFNTFKEEQGIHTLYLACGILNWRDTDTAETGNRAPLILVPVHLERKGRETPFLMRASDEESIAVNPALRYRLGQDFGVDLPILGDDPSVVELTEYLAKVAPRLPAGWTVSEEVWIGRFSFEKFVMYMDLETHKEKALGHPIICALAGAGSSIPHSEYPSEEELDEKPNPSEVFPVFDADASQMRVIVSARAGNNMVVQGPPGTGKSQTIVNVIAQGLRDGKKVLFVSEKMAALSVVYRRLKHRGLAEACLEVHSHRSNKSRILEDLGRALSQPSRSNALSLADARHQFDQLRGAREGLNTYVKELHRRRGAMQTSAFKAHGILAHLDKAPALDFPLPAAKALDVGRTEYDQWRSSIGGVAALASVVDNWGDYPWRSLKLSLDEYDMEIRDRILGWFRAARREVEWLVSAELIDRLGRFGISPPRTIKDVRDAIRLLGALGDAVTVRLGWFDSTSEELFTRVQLASEARQHEENFSSASERVSTYFNQSIYAENVRGWLDRFRGTHRSILRFLSREYWNDRRALQKHSPNPKDFGYGQALAGLELANQVVEGRAWFDRNRETLRATLPERFEVPPMSWESISGGLRWIVGLRGASDNPAPRVAIERAAKDAPELARDARECRVVVEKHLAELSKSVDGLGSVMVLPWSEDSTAVFSVIAPWLKKHESPKLLDDYALFLSARKACEPGEIGAYVDVALQDGVAASDLLPAFDRRFWRVWISACQRESDVLRNFSWQRHENLQEEFRKLDGALKDATKEIIRSQWAEARQPGRKAYSAESELGILQKEIEKKKRHRPMRRLFAEIPTLLQEIKPCLMMSPLSVAAYLAKDSYEFDLVVFDEASQVMPADAIGAILRGKQLMVIGDKRQLPPTRFFHVESESEGEADDEDEAMLESILDECKALGGSCFEEAYLRWHYRSRHEELIAYSNREFYDDALITFPSPFPVGESGALVFEHAKGAVYDRGRSKKNRIEAKRVVELLVEHFSRGEEGSVGVIALSTAQEEAIWEEWEQRKMLDERLEGWADEESESEPFFVKALERVQGDERDFIFLSIGYGPDEKGVVHLNFGPINQMGGERRLNVAVTRARQRTTVVSSVLPQQLDLTRLTTKNRGVESLQRYLEYAQRGGMFPDRAGGTGFAESDFELAVRDALVSRGYKVDCQVGASGFRIDLAIRHPDQPGRYLVGIECDGAAYHSHHTARDRDRLRQEVLQRLGWRFVRIWSTDWIRDPEGVLDRTVQKVEAMRRTPDPGVQVSRPTKLPDEVEVAQPELAVPPLAVVRPSGFPEYRRYVPSRKMDLGRLYRAKRGAREARELADEILSITATEGPIHIDLLMERLREVYGFERTGGRIRDIVDGCIVWLEREGDLALQESKTVLKRRGKGFSGRSGGVVARRPSLGESPRGIEMIPLEELQSGAAVVLSADGGMPLEALVKALAREMGYERTGASVEARVSEAIEAGIASGLLVLTGGKISVARKENG